MVAFFVSIMLITQCATAQDSGDGFKNKTPEQRAQLQTNMMKTKLNLDSAQTLLVQDINLKYAKEIDPVLTGDADRMAKFRQMKSIQEKKNKELKAVLSKDQYKQYEELEEEMKKKFKESARSNQ